MSADEHDDLSGFAIVPRSLLHDGTISPRCKFTWAVVSDFVGDELSIAELAALTGVQHKVAERDLATLAMAGWITWDRDQAPTVIHLKVGASSMGYVVMSA